MAMIRENVSELVKETFKLLQTLPKPQPPEEELYEYEEKDKTSFEITREDDGAFVVYGGLIDNLARKVVIDDYDSMRFLQRTLISTGVIAALRKRGAKDGSIVRMGDIEFDFVD